MKKRTFIRFYVKLAEGPEEKIYFRKKNLKKLFRFFGL